MTFKVNISIDDVSPHAKSSITVLDRCYELIKEIPDIKFTLFVPVAYWRTMRANIATKDPLYISKYPVFCRALNCLPKENFEVAYHGYHHGIPGKSDNDELRYLNYEDAIALYKKMFGEVKKAGIDFKKIIRPPAWRMSPDAIRAAKDVDFKVLALSADKYPDGSLDYGGEDKKFGNVVYYNVCPPFKPLKMHEKTEIVYHACEWDRNYLSSAHTDELKQFLLKHKEKIEYCFMEEMV